MPKLKKTDKEVIMFYVNSYNEEFIYHAQDKLYCKICECFIKHSKKYFIESHRKCKKHYKYLKNKNDTQDIKKIQQTFLSESYDQYVEVVVRAFTSANIPLFKLNNSNIIKMFEYFGKPAISESKARSYILERLRTENISKLVTYFKDEKIFLEIDESEIKGKKYVNILAGTIRNPCKIFILNVIEVGNLSVDNELILTYLDVTLHNFSINLNQIILIITDAAKYMVKAFKVLSNQNYSFFHVTCLAHLIHNCAIRIKASYINVDNCIARIKLITIKNKSNADLFKNIGKPPDVIVTRWSSWLKAAIYYATHLPSIKGIVNSIDNEGILVKRAKEALRNEFLISDLMEIVENYSNLINILDKFEESYYNIETGYCTLLNMNFGRDPIELKLYIDKRLKANGISDLIDLVKEEITPIDYVHLKKCPPTSIAVERSFSMLGKMLTNERNFRSDNIYHYFSEYYNKFD